MTGRARRLLGRHVGHRPHDVPVRRVRVGLLIELFRQPEVQKHHPAAPRHHHVRRLDVAMQSPLRMKFVEDLRKLFECSPQARIVRAPGAGRSAARVGDAGSACVARVSTIRIPLLRRSTRARRVAERPAEGTPDRPSSTAVVIARRPSRRSDPAKYRTRLLTVLGELPRAVVSTLSGVLFGPGFSVPAKN